MNPKILLLSVDHHFLKTPDGKIWAEGIHDLTYWNKYLISFDKIYALVRLKNGSYEEAKNYIFSSCEKVEFYGIPFFQGPWQYLKKYIEVNIAISKAVRKKEICCAIFRLPSTIGFSAFYKFRKTKKPIGIEVVANLKDRSYYSQGIMKALLYFLLSKQLQNACNLAQGISYVTKRAIQKNFPPNPKAIIANYSSIDLLEDFFYPPEKKHFSNKTLKLIHISTLSNMEKGHKTLLYILKELKNKQYNVSCTVIGGGSCKPLVEALAVKLKIKDLINFTGNIGSKEKLRELLIEADLFVFPTCTEGLPRVVIEAMACSLPCISTDVGGISELLDSQYLLKPDDVDSYVNLIINLIENPKKMHEQSICNFKKAKEYSYKNLIKKRKSFFNSLINIS